MDDTVLKATIFFQLIGAVLLALCGYPFTDAWAGKQVVKVDAKERQQKSKETKEKR